MGLKYVTIALLTVRLSSLPPLLKTSMVSGKRSWERYTLYIKLNLLDAGREVMFESMVLTFG